ncbi:tetratricopeptide repeat protein [Nocardia asteroides]|uniref:tetratricopeptide repeat protein n=1 Tax=Nocardia asteroides TaxID=1824 RepID=UPI001E578D7C|nr:tetratricopeptide repeat protein [Nocardia asteroides]UGT59163.1 tetratricopeptide repeat protein [Nocardia asteroides]
MTPTSDPGSVGKPEGAGDAMLAAGAAAYARGDVTEALRIFRAASTGPDEAIRLAALTNAASMHDELGQHAEALPLLREALALMPADAIRVRPHALINLSQVQQHLGDLEGAQVSLDEARTLLADSTDPELGRVRVACLLSRTAVAIHRDHWSRALELATESLDAAVRFAPDLAGHPLLNLAAAHFETGRTDLALDFAAQARAAFTEADDPNARAEADQNTAIMLARSGRPAEAAEPLRRSQEYFERAGLAHRAGIGAKLRGFLAEGAEQFAAAEAAYGGALARFEASGAVLDAAEVRVRLATVAARTGRLLDAETLLDQAFSTCAERGMTTRCAQIDYWHAALIEAAQPDRALLARGTDLAVIAALALDAVRFTFADGTQRARWHDEIADPALQVAFRLAYASGNGQLIAELIETRCAGTTIDLDRSTGAAAAPTLPLTWIDPPDEQGGALTAGGALELGIALAEVAAAAGLAVAPPPRIALPDGRIALAAHLAAAEQRYGRPVRDSRVVRL